MKICYLNYFNPLKIHGGAERVILREAELVAQSGNKAVIITTHNRRDLDIATLEKGKIKVWFVPAFPRVADGSFMNRSMSLLLSLLNPLLTVRVSRILSVERPDIVHVHHLGPMSLGVVYAAKLLDCKIVQTFHGYFFECPRGGLQRRSGEVCIDSPLICKMYKQIYKEAMRRCDAIIAVSHFVKKRLVRAGYRSDDISVIPNSIPGISKDSLTRHPVANNKEILFVGRMVKGKGPHVLIKALVEVQKSHDKSFTVNFIGNGEDRTYFETLAHSSGVDVNFLGKVPDKILEKHYESARLVVVPSLFPELFAIVVTEAMSHGKPVVASDIGGVPELVSHGHTGFLFEPNDASALARYIGILLADEKLAINMGERALEVSEKFSESNHLQMLLNLYERVLSK